MRVLLVCTGNTCRSAMGEYILKYLLKSNKITDVKVDSCGIYADINADMSENAKYALSCLGIKKTRHKAKQFIVTMLDKADIVIVMTNQQKQLLRQDEKIKTLGELCSYTDIPDPYGQDKDVYLKVANDLFHCFSILIKKGYFS